MSVDLGRRRAGAAALRGIYALVEPERRPALPFVRELLAGGIRLFQIRAKSGIAHELLAAIVHDVRAAGGLTIVNDDVQLALAADGVHLGQEDAALHEVRAVRERLADRIIGLSCGTPAEARAAGADLFDYIGVGPIFATASKADAGLPIGVSGVRAVAAASPLPAAAIGGIDLAALPRVRETGVAMAAIVSALSGSANATETARSFVAAWTT